LIAFEGKYDAIKSQKLLDFLENHIIPCLKNLLHTFKASSADSIKQLENNSLKLQSKTIQLTKDQSTFLKTLCKLVQLDPAHCWYIIQGYLKLELQISKESDFGYGLEYIDAVIDYYYTERLSLLALVQAIFLASKDEQSSHHNMANRLLEKLKPEELVQETIKQFEGLTLERPSEDMRSDPSKLNNWALQILDEEKRLLGFLFLIYYDHSVCKPADYLKLLAVMRQCRFGRKQCCMELNLPQSSFEKNYRDIELSCLVILIASLSLEGLMDDISMPENTDDNYLLQSPRYLLEITDEMDKLELIPTYGPLFISWGLFLSRVSYYLDLNCPAAYSSLHKVLTTASNIEKETHQYQTFQRFLVRGYSLNAFTHLQQLLVSLKEDDHPNDLGYLDVIKCVYELLMVSFKVTQLPNYDSIVDGFRSLFLYQPDLCTQFWYVSYVHNGRRALLDTTMLRFPAQFHNFTILLAAVSSGPVAASYGLNYLAALPYYTEIGVDRHSDFETSTSDHDGERQIKIISPRQVGVSSHGYSLEIPEGQTGKIISTPGAEWWVVQWEWDYSVWGFLANILIAFASCSPSAFLQKITLFTTDYDENPVDIVKDTMALYDSILTNNPDLLPYLVQHMATILNGGVTTKALAELFLNTLDRTFTLAANKTFGSIRASCLRCLTVIARNHPTDMWTLLRKSQFATRVLIPKLSSSAISSYNCCNGLSLLDSTTGHYPATLSLLDLFVELSSDINSFPEKGDENGWKEKSQVMSNCLHFINMSVLPHVEGVAYLDTNERFLLGYKIFSLFNQVMKYHNDDQAPNSSSKGVNIHLYSLQDNLKQFYLGENGSYYLVPLLNIIGTSPQTIQYLCKRQKLKAARILEDLINEALKFCCHLLRRGSSATDTSKIYLLEQKLITRVAKGKRDVLTNLVEYLFYSENVQLRLHSLKVMSLLCKVISEWKPRPPSLVAYFGENAKLMVNAMMHILDDDSMDQEVHYATWEFIVYCARTQPGLALLLLRGEPLKSVSEKPPKNSPQFDQSLLPSAIEVLTRSLNDSNGPRLLGLLELLDHLWQSPRDNVLILNYLRESKHFWNSFSSLLCQPRPGIYPKGVENLIKGALLRIVAMEIFYHSAKSSPTDGRLHFQGKNELFSALLQKILQRATFESNFKSFLQFSLDTELIEGFQQFHDLFEPIPTLECALRPYPNAEFEMAKFDMSNYLYDVEHIHAIFRSRLAHNEEDFGRALQLIMDINSNWAIADSEVVLIRSSTTFLEIASTCLPGLPSWEQMNPGESLYSLLSMIIENVSSDRRVGWAAEKVRLDFSRVILSLVAAWSEALSNSTIQLQKLEELLSLLSSMLHNISTELEVSNKAGYVENLLAACLILVQLSVKKDTVGKYSDKNTRLQLFSTCCTFISTAVKDNTTALKPIEPKYFEVLTSLITKCVSNDKQLHPSRWLEVLFLHEVPQRLIELYSFCLSHPDTNETTFQCVLYVLLALVRTPAAAERFAVCSILNTFGNNPLSPAVQGGSLGLFIDGSRNPWHKSWCLTLSIITSMLKGLGDSDKFVESVGHFIQLHGLQLCKSLDLSTVDNLTIAHFEEAEATTALFHQFLVHFHQQHTLSPQSVFQVFQAASVVLGYFTYLFTHPVFLSSRMDRVLRVESPPDQKVGTENENDQLDVTCSFFKYPLAFQKMFAIYRNICFMMHTVQQWPQKQRIEWNMDILFVPSMNSSSVSGASIGNLYDFLNFVTSVITKLLASPSSSNADVSQQYTTFIHIIEGTSSLLITQLIKCMSSHLIPKDVKDALQIDCGKECTLLLQRIEDTSGEKLASQIPEAKELKQFIRQLREVFEIVLPA
jgi:AcrR family transcriptional regulator